MSYLTIEFSVIFLGFFILYWSFKNKPIWQNSLILVASYAILASFNAYFAVILGVYTLVVYLFSLMIYSSKHQRLWLTIAIIMVVTNLAVFKYFDFFIEELQILLNAAGVKYVIPTADIIMPLGISFYTFHSISYLVAVKKAEIKKIKLFDLALFLAFFPSVIAGPINQVHSFLAQINTAKPREVLAPYRIFSLIIFALFKVYWLSSFISETWVNPVFSNPSQYHSLDLIFTMYVYGIELYLNFSGYIDLVTAIALLLGFNIQTNFNLPYLATNLRDFWHRWHISLSSWIRDYIYIPLGGSRKGFVRMQCHLIIAMLLSALWHGITLNFIIWGLLHGVGMVLYNVWHAITANKISQDKGIFISRLITVSYVSFAWIFFRSPSINESFDYLNAMINNFDMPTLTFNSLFYLVMLFAVYYFYPFLSKAQSGMIYIMKHVHWIFLPLLLIPMLWFIINCAPSGIPNFIYAGF